MRCPRTLLCRARFSRIDMAGGFHGVLRLRPASTFPPGSAQDDLWFGAEWIDPREPAHIRKRAPNFFPRIRLVAKMVIPRKSMAQTPSAEATKRPSPSN